jgi:chromate transporter
MRHRTSLAVQGFVKGVYAAAMGAILGATILLGGRAVEDWITALIAVGGLIALLRFRIRGPLLVGAAAVFGLVAFQLVYTK